MANRLKEDEKNERIVRNLLKQSGNKKCINCGSLGPQYVCTTFSIFVCTACSGVHREFSHRVKSVSMAKFTAAEVADLQAGGNEHARAVYFKEWDPQRNPLPDNSNPDKLRSFIKNVYEEKRYTGEKSTQRARQNDRDELEYPKHYESRPNSRSVPQSPSYEERYEDRSLNNRPGARNRDIGHANSRYSDEDIQYDPKKSPGRFDRDRGKLETYRHEDRQYDERGYRTERYRGYDERDRNYNTTRSFPPDEKERDRNRHSHGPDYPVEDSFSSREAPEGRKSDATRKEPEGRQPHIAYVKDNYRSSASLQKNGFPRLALAPVNSQKNSKSPPSLESSGIGQPSANATAASTLTRADSFSLIDFSAEPEIPAETVLTSPTKPTALSSAIGGASSDGNWAKFDTSATSELQSISMSSNSINDFFTSTNVNPPKVESTAPAGSIPVSAADNWASFGGNMQPFPFSSPFAEQNNPQGSSISTQPAHLQPQFPQEEKKVLTNSSTNVHPSGKREPIPEDLFVFPTPGSGQSTNLGFGFPNSSQTLERPLLGAFPQGLLPSYGQPPYSQFKASGNPFDLPGDFSSQPMKHDMFPSMGSLQTALPTALPPAVTAEDMSRFSATAGPQNLLTAQLPYLAAVPPAAPYPGGTPAFGELAHLTMQDNHLRGNSTLLSGNFGLAPGPYSQSSLPATTGNPFG